MKLADSYYDVMNLSEGYVSHSFAQQIETDGKYIYRADLGDAYPRGIALTATKVGDQVKDPSMYGTVIAIPGDTGYNYTGYTLNDLKLGTNNYILTGTGIKNEKDLCKKYLCECRIEDTFADRCKVDHRTIQRRIRSRL